MTDSDPAFGSGPSDVFGHEPHDAQDVLEAIDLALDDHRLWMKSWHKGVVCRLKPAPEILAKKPHQETRFGIWLETYRDRGLMKQPAFRELEAAFTDLTAFARFLALRSQDGQPIPPEEYDALGDKEDRFVSQARRLQDAFRKAVSELDPLTGLSNRQVMLRELAAEYERAVRSGAACCIALSDIDHFKNVNDTYGHAVGDQVLIQVAGRLLSRLRPYDNIYRYGGEEFLIVLPNANEATAMMVLERLRHALAEKPLQLEDGKELSITSSFGLAMVSQDAELKDVIERADAALYHAKQKGRNRVAAWTGDMTNHDG
ncbi:diguanylate cyclase [Aestuariispira insulae]|uniref:diguanylate cyclase n=1 Tax=Aestuariispira insulae TaxID=1461337 RepID=A0A3D9HS55_9PROT|nr:diguanylate cyclase [Aestuariispira insulae]RED52324.1 diguanylate cyclase (GGDEF)-like protein [Aestuariispira insulae]